MSLLMKATIPGTHGIYQSFNYNLCHRQSAEKNI
jgi:hypothetical protein